MARETCCSTPENYFRAAAQPATAIQAGLFLSRTYACCLRLLLAASDTLLPRCKRMYSRVCVTIVFGLRISYVHTYVVHIYLFSCSFTFLCTRRVMVGATFRLRRCDAGSIFVVVMMYIIHQYDFVVRTVGACTVRPNLCVVQERAPTSLFDLLHKTDVMSGSLPTQEKAAMLYDVARGLQYLHIKRIVHGDLKSTNVLVFENNRLK